MTTGRGARPARQAFGATAWLLFSALGAAAHPAHAELTLDRPYLGEDVVPEPTRELAALCEDADLVFEGTTLVLEAPEAGTTFAGSVRVERVHKGTLSEGTLELAWKPSATGIEAGSRHLFFVQGTADAPVVLKEMYIRPGADGFIRAYGYLDGATHTALAVVEALLHPDRPRKAAAELLLRDARGSHFQRRQTAARLALELRTAEVVPALAELVRTEDDLFGTLAVELLRLGGVERLADVLDAVPVAPVVSRERETLAFAAIAAAGGPEFAEPLAAFGDAHPELRVSCAFALAGIGAPSAAPAMRRWIAEAEADGSTEHVGDGGRAEVRSRAELLQEVLRTL